MFVDEDGKQVEFVYPLDDRKEVLERFRDLLALFLRDAGRSHQEISRALGVTVDDVKKTLRHIPKPAKDFYRERMPKVDGKSLGKMREFRTRIMVRLAEEGVPQETIGEVLGVVREAVRNQIIRAEDDAEAERDPG